MRPLDALEDLQETRISDIIMFRFGDSVCDYGTPGSWRGRRFFYANGVRYARYAQYLGYPCYPGYP